MSGKPIADNSNSYQEEKPRAGILREPDFEAEECNGCERRLTFGGFESSSHHVQSCAQSVRAKPMAILSLVFHKTPHTLIRIKEKYRHIFILINENPGNMVEL